MENGYGTGVGVRPEYRDIKSTEALFRVLRNFQVEFTVKENLRKVSRESFLSPDGGGLRVS